MSVLALISDDDALSAAQAAQQIDMLRRAQDYVRASDVLDDLMEIRRKAKLVGEWVRIHNAAQEIALEACKLDWLALRKIGAIDPAVIKSGSLRKAARWLAGLNQDEFDERLVAMRFPLGPVTAQREAEREAEREELRQVGRGELFDGRRYDLGEVADAVDVLLTAARAEGMSSTAALRELLKDALPGDWAGDLVNEGIEQVVRQAFRSQSLPDGYPAWVTWHSDAAGWVHVPWDAATLEQLEWMADYRHGQAADLAKSALQLDGLVRVMRAYSSRLGGAQRLEVLRRARQQAQAERDQRWAATLAAERAEHARGEHARAARRRGLRRSAAADTGPRCAGTVRRHGSTRPCRNPPVPGSDRCEYHQAEAQS